MNRIGPATGDLDPAVLSAPGGLVWWYVDLVDGEGNGAVCIWSFGLPFLPGVASAARRGQGQPAGDRPSLNLAVYREGRPVLYLLQEVPPEETHWEGDRVRIGGLVATRRIDGDRVHLDVDIDTVLTAPELPLRAHLTVSGPLRTGLDGDRDPAHSWEPITLGAARGELNVACGSVETTIVGRAYHDRNGGMSPLHALGLSAWRWGRLALPDRELVYALLEGEGADSLIEVDGDGRAVAHAIHGIEASGWRRGWFGPAWPQILTLDTDLGPVTIHHQHQVEDAPFYQRWLVSAETAVGAGPGIAESVRIAHLDRAWMRPLIRMRVDAGPASSRWLSWFSGPRR